MYKATSRYVQHVIDSDDGNRNHLRYIQRENEKRIVANTLKIGSVYEGRIEKILDHGALVNIQGLWTYLHISEISNEWLDHPSKLLKIKQIMPVKVLSKSINEKNQISVKVSIKQI